MRNNLVISIALVLGMLIIQGCGRPSVPEEKIQVKNFGNIQNNKIVYDVFIPSSIPSGELLRYQYISSLFKKSKSKQFVYGKNNDVLVALMYGQGNDIYTANNDYIIPLETQRFAGFAAGFSSGYSSVQTGMMNGGAIAASRAREAAEIRAARVNNFMKISLFDTKTQTQVYSSEISYNTSLYSFEELVPTFIKVFTDTLGKVGLHRLDVSEYK